MEKVYHECLYYEIQKSGLQVQKEVYVHVDYEEIKIERAFKIDLLVENKLIVELKSVKELNDLFTAQILTYLKLSKIRLGLLINFNELLLKDGIRRVINN